LKLFKVFFVIFFIFELLNLNSFYTLALSAEEINSPSAILMEAETGKVLFEKSSHEARNCAALSKIMTLLVAMKIIKEKNIPLESAAQTSEYAASIGGAHVWLKNGERMVIHDLIKSILIASANDATITLVEHVSGSESDFVKKMNDIALKIGMKNSSFKTCLGIDMQGHVSSAFDIALAARKLIKYPEILKYSTIWMDSLRNGQTQIVNTNRLIKIYKGATGLKTGTTEKAGSCICATAKRDNLNLICVSLGAKTGKDRLKDATLMLDYGFANFTISKPKAVDESRLFPVKVKNGMKNNVKLKIKNSGEVLLPKGKENGITSTFEICPEIEAPIKTGQILGKIIYKLNEEALAENPLVAAEDIKK